MPVDLLMSSGFLAFGRQVGFLDAVVERGVDVDGVFGVSSGAMTGALFAAGMHPQAIFDELTSRTPITECRLHAAPWRGLLSLRQVIARLSELLPPTFADLDRPFGAGVMDRDGQFRFLTSGPLPAAIAASCAIPTVFRPVEVEGEWFQDGGASDRLGLEAWRGLRGERPVLVHLVARSAGAKVTVDLSDLPVVHSARSGASLLRLGDAAGRRAETRTTAEGIIADHAERLI